MPTTLDRSRIADALAHEPRIAKTGLALQDCLAHVAALPPTLEALWGQLRDDDDRRLDFALALGIAAVIEREPPELVERTVELDFDHAEVTVFRGDLHVKGDFRFARDVVVLGDLRVDGILEDTYEHMSLLVTGSVRAAAIRCRHHLWSGGEVQAEILVVGRRGTVQGERVVADVIIVTTDEGTSVSHPTAKTFIEGEAMMMAGAEAMAELRTVLVPECFADCDDDYFDDRALFACIRAGRRWAQSGP